MVFGKRQSRSGRDSRTSTDAGGGVGDSGSQTMGIFPGRSRIVGAKQEFAHLAFAQSEGEIYVGAIPTLASNDLRKSSYWGEG